MFYTNVDSKFLGDSVLYSKVIRLREEPIPFCILKVVTPGGQTIRFNITGRSLPWPEDNIIHGHIPETEDTTVQPLVHKSNGNVISKHI